jgi:hypothetical protein
MADMPTGENLTTTAAFANPFDRPHVGAMHLSGYPLRQCDRYSCGPAVVVLARAILEPMFAQALAGTAPDGFVEAQHAAHRAANVLWPRVLGMTPWGVAAALSVHNRRYGWRPLRPVRRPLAAAIDAVDRGWPVPLLIGGGIPRHWILLLGRDGEHVLCYEPSAGHVLAVTVDDLRAGRVSALGFANPQAVVLPDSTTGERADDAPRRSGA